MPKAIKVRADNLWYIIQYGNELKMDLSHVKDNFTLASEEGWEFYVITDGTLVRNNVTFTEMYASDFEFFWKFAEDEEPYEFVEIIKTH